MTVAGIIRTPVVSDRVVENVDYAVLGPTDGRVRVVRPGPPFNAICHIERDFGEGRLSGCTGFLIAPRVLITAGHCTFSLLRRRPPKRIRVSAGRDGAQRPFGAIWARRWFAHPLFIDGADPRYDFGVVILPRAFAGLAPGFTLRALSSADLARARDTKLIHIAGYPSDKTRGQMWTHAERIDRFGSRLIQYSVDTCPGHSGAPVWLSAENGFGDVIAIHTRGPKPSAKGPWGCRPGAPLAPAGFFNAGVRVTPDLRQSVINAVRGRGPLRMIGADPSGS